MPCRIWFRNKGALLTKERGIVHRQPLTISNAASVQSRNASATQSKLPSTVLLANSLSEANGMAVTPLQANVVGNGHYATAELLAGNRFKRLEHA